MIIALPTDTPVTVPEDITMATEALLVVHKPAGVTSLKVVLAPAQMPVFPRIGDTDGGPVTVTLMVAVAVPQPLITVYDITVEPADIPVTVPVPLTVAIVKSKLLHEPPVPVVDKPEVAPTQIEEVPLIVPASGAGLIVTVAAILNVPQLLVTE